MSSRISWLARRLAGLLAVVAISGAAVAVPAGSAQAACASGSGHVYITGGRNLITFPGNIFRWEFEPTDPPLQTFTVGINGALRLGGNLLEPGSQPSWVLYNEATGRPLARFLGAAVGGNCVANERDIPIGIIRGTYIARVDYVAGNTNKIVTGQAHFRVIIA